MSIENKLDSRTLELLGLKPKDLKIYVALLRLGAAPLRRVAEETNLNRGTTYDSLKRLIELGLVSYVDAKKHRYFTGEDPQKLRGLATRREVAVQEARLKVKEIIPELQEVMGNSKHRPTVRYYEGEKGVRDILEDVFETTSRIKVSTEHAESIYRVYSSAAIRDLIVSAWPSYKKQRIKKGINVRAISIGEGGKTVGMDERKWLTKQAKAPTYIIIYPGKTAYVSVDESKKLFGVIIEDKGISSTQTMIFDSLWESL